MVIKRTPKQKSTVYKRKNPGGKRKSQVVVRKSNNKKR
jgi:hypothetical protein